MPVPSLTTERAPVGPWPPALHFPCLPTSTRGCGQTRVHAHAVHGHTDTRTQATHTPKPYSSLFLAFTKSREFSPEAATRPVPSASGAASRSPSAVDGEADGEVSGPRTRGGGRPGTRHTRSLARPHCWTSGRGASTAAQRPAARPGREKPACGAPDGLSAASQGEAPVSGSWRPSPSTQDLTLRPLTTSWPRLPARPPVSC